MYLPYSRFDSKLREIERSYGVDFTYLRERLKHVLDNSLFKVVELENNQAYDISKGEVGLAIYLAYKLSTNSYTYYNPYRIETPKTFHHNRLNGFFDEPSYLVIVKKCNNLVTSAL